MKEVADFRKLGGKIHSILNHTLTRRLTREEYKKLVELMSDVFDAAQSRQ